MHCPEYSLCQIVQVNIAVVQVNILRSQVSFAKATSRKTSCPTPKSSLVSDIHVASDQSEVSEVLTHTREVLLSVVCREQKRCSADSLQLKLETNISLLSCSSRLPCLRCGLITYGQCHGNSPPPPPPPATATSNPIKSTHLCARHPLTDGSGMKSWHRRGVQH